MTLIPKSWPGWARKATEILGIGGIGATIALTLVDQEHHYIVETFRAWGPGTFLGLVAFVLVVPRAMDLGREMISTQKDTALAMQRLADGVAAIANKDDERAREQELVVNHLVRNSARILNEVSELKQLVLGRSGGQESASAHSAGR